MTTRAGDGRTLAEAAPVTVGRDEPDRREERAGGVVVLTLDRPPVNALETSFVRDLAAALEAESREAQDSC